MGDNDEDRTAPQDAVDLGDDHELGRALQEVADSLLWGRATEGYYTWLLKPTTHRKQTSHDGPWSWMAHTDKCLQVLGFERGISERFQQQQQEKTLEDFSEIDKISEHGYLFSATREGTTSARKLERLAIRVSNLANLLVFAAKISLSFRSGSLAIFASTFDSLLDLVSGFVLSFTYFSMRIPQAYRIPIGKKWMQPVGILVFILTMTTVGLQIVYKSARKLIAKDSSSDFDKDNLDWIIGVMAGALLVKLGLMICCRTFSNEIVRAYAPNLITDVIGLVSVVLAYILAWWIDPVGAIVLALYTMGTRSMTASGYVNSLVSKTASPDYLQKVTYMCWNHHKDIRQIDTVRVYTFGSHYFAEVDIVLPGDMPLHRAHDIGKSLQNKLESSEIERAFVHLDYEKSHRTEHVGHDYK